MKRPSRGFLWTAFGLLLVVAALAGLWVRLQPPAPVRPAPDVWTLGGTAGVIRDAPDGRPIQGWVFAGHSGALPPNPGRMPFLVLVPEGQAVPSIFDGLKSRVTGDPSRHVDARYLYCTEDVVTTPSGRWERYSTRWWKGAKPPPAPAPAPATK